MCFSPTTTKTTATTTTHLFNIKILSQANYSEFPSFAVNFLTQTVKVPSSFVMIFGMRPIHQHENLVSASVLAEYDCILEQGNTSVVSVY